MTLIDRLSKLDGPDREVDAEIWLLNTPGATRKWTEVKSSTNRWKPYTIDETRDETGRLVAVPTYTASIDAALALAERVLPGWNGDLDIGKPIADSGKIGCRIWTPESKYHNYVGEGFNSATALLIALLRAKGSSNG